LQWVTKALERVKKFAQIEGIAKVQAHRKRLTQLKITLASAECLLQHHPEDQFLKNVKNKAHRN